VTDAALPFPRERLSATERGLFDGSLAFFGAAARVIDYAGPGRPRVLFDALGLEAVRDAMGTLEERIRAAGAEGVPAERITRITRLERDVVDLILRRRGGR